MRLDQYQSGDYTPGRGLLVQLAWFFIGSPLLASRLVPPSALKVAVLRWFGARIGRGVRIKPGMRVKFPWRLEIGDHAWIGEDVWIDNLAPVVVGDHCCVSQAAYFCTGSHDWSRESFDLRCAPITLADQVWICARATLGPGVTANEGAVLSLGSVAVRDLEAWTIYQGDPAQPVKTRKRSSDPRPPAEAPGRELSSRADGP